MLCSVPAGAGKSASNWLDRLRSTKGFPTDPDLALDHFLSAPQTAPTSASQPPPPPDPPAVTDDGSRRQWCGIMTNVLSELFHMGDPEPLPAKKSLRKQANPKFFPTSNDDCLRKEGNALSFNSDNNLVERAAEEEEDELVGYSRSEVTVIDTSCSGWKLEKLLYRKKNVWKARDRKGKGRSGLGRKKRRAGGNGDDDILHGKKKKKLKLSGLEFDSSNEVIEATERGKRDVSRQIVKNNLRRGPKMRFPSSGSHIQLRNGSSSVVLIKGIQAAKKKKKKREETSLSKSHNKQ